MAAGNDITVEYTRKGCYRRCKVLYMYKLLHMDLGLWPRPQAFSYFYLSTCYNHMVKSINVIILRSAHWQNLLPFIYQLTVICSYYFPLLGFAQNIHIGRHMLMFWKKYQLAIKWIPFPVRLNRRLVIEGILCPVAVASNWVGRWKLLNWNNRRTLVYIGHLLN